MCGMDRQALGRLGEAAAAAALERRGYRIIRRNVRTRFGEIDLVALHDGAVVFVEVKTRTGAAFGRPAEAVSPAKQRRLSRLARAFLQQGRLAGRACRFDVVAVEVAPGGRVEAVEIVPHAFEASV